LGHTNVYFVSLFLSPPCAGRFASEDTISGMVAMRYNRTSYFCILTAMFLGAFSCCFIICSAIAKQALNIAYGCQSENSTFYLQLMLYAGLSPIATVCILLVPVVVYKTREELGFIPGNNEQATTDRMIRVPHDNPVLVPVHKVDPTNPLYAMYMWKGLSDFMHRAIHCLCVGTGVGFGFAAMGMYLNEHRTDSSSLEWHALLSLAIVSAVFLVGFVICALLHPCLYGHAIFDRISVFCELFGLYYYLVAINYLACVTGGLVSYTNSCLATP
jgi:hypothetical protein